MHSAIVTGGQGFIGRNLVHELRRRGIRTTTVGRRASDDISHFVLDDGSWASSALDRVLEEARPNYIFHLAGTARGTPDELSHANSGMAQALFQSLRRTRLRPRIVVAGSAAEYGSAIKDGEPVCETAICSPLSAYGVSKYAQTRAALAHAEETGTPLIVARIFNALGPNMPSHLALGDFVNQIASMRTGIGTLYVGNIDVRRDMIDVERIATVLCDLADNSEAGGIVNVCSGEAPLLRELVEKMISFSGRDVKIEIDWNRVRGNEVRTILGSTDLLAKLGCPPSITDFSAVVARICRFADLGATQRS
jgi:GDP-4-dehydro-6-deoxy-D-mannose reductase